MNVPPINSLGFSLFTFALSASSFVFAAIYDSPFADALNTIGVIKPDSVATAMLMSAFSNFLMNFPNH